LSAIADTDVLIDYLRGLGAAIGLLEPLIADGALAASVITKAELFAGSREAQRPALGRLFESVAWLPVTDDVAVRAGGLWREFRRTDARSVLADYLIAATVELFEVPLLTRNIRHFPMFPGLRAPYTVG
jgi:predicted nucleic acid-binding protein